jgi:Protein of unknown function (DUF1353)
MARSQDLKLRARELFAPALAHSVIRQIEADEKRLNRKRANLRGVAHPESLATLWLGDELYAELGTGTFSGCPTVRWNGIFDDGRDAFMFLPDAAKAFTYTTSAKLGSKTIAPRLMVTDGGSIPRVLWGLSDFSPWGYAPGYMIHDWLFVAHKCKIGPDNAWTFEQSARVLAECIKTLMETGFTDFDGKKRTLAKAEDSLYLIYKAVGSDIAKDYWNDRTPIDCRVPNA